MRRRSYPDSDLREVGLLGVGRRYEATKEQQRHDGQLAPAATSARALRTRRAPSRRGRRPWRSRAPVNRTWPSSRTTRLFDLLAVAVRVYREVASSRRRGRWRVGARWRLLMAEGRRRVRPTHPAGAGPVRARGEDGGVVGRRGAERGGIDEHLHRPVDEAPRGIEPPRPAGARDRRPQRRSLAAGLMFVAAPVPARPIADRRVVLPDHDGPDDVAVTGDGRAAGPADRAADGGSLFTGEVEHRDSLGTHAWSARASQPDDGRLGIAHWRRPPRRRSVLHGVQLWTASRRGAPHAAGRRPRTRHRRSASRRRRASSSAPWRAEPRPHRHGETPPARRRVPPRRRADAAGLRVLRARCLPTRARSRSMASPSSAGSSPTSRLAPSG